MMTTAAVISRLAVISQPRLSDPRRPLSDSGAVRIAPMSAAISTRSFSSQHHDATRTTRQEPSTRTATIAVAESDAAAPVGAGGAATAAVAVPAAVSASLISAWPSAPPPSAPSAGQLLQEADRLWGEVTADPRRLDASATLITLRLLRRAGAEGLQRQMDVIDQAMRLEQTVAEADQQAAATATANAATTLGGASAITVGSRPAPVFVDSACVAVLLDSLTAHFGRPDGVAEAQAAFATMIQRASDAGALGQRSRAHRLRVTEGARNAYLRFLQRAGLTGDVLRLWAAQSPADKESNPAGLAVVLRALALADDAHGHGHGHGHGQLRAARLMDTDGARLQWTPELCGAWLSCFARRGDWRAAEDAWRRMRQRGVALDGDAHCKLMQIYIGSGEVEQLAKIEPLYAQMQNSSSSSGSGSAESSSRRRCTSRSATSRS